MDSGADALESLPVKLDFYTEMVFLFVHLLFVLISKNKAFIYLTDKDSKDFEMKSPNKTT